MRADQLFLILYRELYYRHVYSRLQPDIDDRFHSYENSCELFNYLLSAFSLARTLSVHS
jgi:translation initiation factor 3 subunit L